MSDTNGLDREALAHRIDHTALKPDVTLTDIARLCDEAQQYGFYSVCVNPSYVSSAKKVLGFSHVKVVSVIGFPLGATKKEVKALEAREALKDGADELDMVINIGLLKSRNLEVVREDISSVVSEAKARRALVKVILETCYLTEEEKVLACRIAEQSGADFVKTSTGFGSAGATLEDVRLLRKSTPSRMGVKAAGGIQTTEQALAMLSVGATRIGSSKSVKIIEGLPSVHDRASSTRVQ